MTLLIIIALWLWLANALAWATIVLSEEPSASHAWLGVVAFFSPLAPFLFIWYVLFIYHKTKAEQVEAPVDPWAP